MKEMQNSFENDLEEIIKDAWTVVCEGLVDGANSSGEISDVVAIDALKNFRQIAELHIEDRDDTAVLEARGLMREYDSTKIKADVRKLSLACARIEELFFSEAQRYDNVLELLYAANPSEQSFSF